MENRDSTPEEVADWMMSTVKAKGELYQEDAVSEIEARFGNIYIYENENGNPAIGRNVLSAFRRISDDVVWERAERKWRMRENSDEPGRRQE